MMNYGSFQRDYINLVAKRNSDFKEIFIHQTEALLLRNRNNKKINLLNFEISEIKLKIEPRDFPKGNFV